MEWIHRGRHHATRRHIHHDQGHNLPQPRRLRHQHRRNPRRAASVHFHVRFRHREFAPGSAVRHALPFTVTSSPPVNDNIANATVITSSNFPPRSTIQPRPPNPPIRFPPVFREVRIRIPGRSGGRSLPPATPSSRSPRWGVPTTPRFRSGPARPETSPTWPAMTTSLRGNIPTHYLHLQLTLAPSTTSWLLPTAPRAGVPPAAQAGGKTVLNVTHAPLAPAAPAITSPNAATYILGVEGKFTFKATGSPAPTFSESGSASWWCSAQRHYRRVNRVPRLRFPGHLSRSPSPLSTASGLPPRSISR